MSESSVSAQNALTGVAGVAPHAGSYQLSDDLARLCLPQEFKDSYRTLAWVNSICALFLLIGLVGLKPPKVVVRQISKPEDVVPVIFTPPEEPPKAEPEMAKPDEPPPPDTPTDVPQVAAVLAAADPTTVAFAVPVQGAVAIAPQAHLASPPPLVTHMPTGPTRFNPNAGNADGGSYPPPMYPPIAERNHYEGTVTIEIMVDPVGQITSTKVQKSSGFSVLDEAALEVVKKRWRFPQGQNRWLVWSCVFKF